MAISEGQTRVTLQLDGKGNAVAHMKQVEGGFAVIISKAQMLGEAGEKLASGLDRSFEKARKGTLTFRDGLDAALDVASAFGPVGKIVAGVGKSITAIVDGLWDLFATTPKFSDFGTAILSGLGPANQLAASMFQLARGAAEASKQLTAVKNSALLADAAAARSRGDEDAAKRLEAQAALNTSEDDTKSREAALRDARKRVTDATTAIPQIKRQLDELDQQAYTAKMQGDAQAEAAATTVMLPLRAALATAQATLKDAIPAVEAAYDDYTASLRKLSEDALRAQPGFVEFDESEANPKGPGGGKPAPKKTEAERKQEARLELIKALNEGDQRAIDLAFEADKANGIRLDSIEGVTEAQVAAEDQQARLNEYIREYLLLADAANDNPLADRIRDFGEALTESLPGLAEHLGLVEQLSGTWVAALELRKEVDRLEADSNASPDAKLKAREKAQAAVNAAVRQSIAVGAQAAASFVKDESAKQAILAITQLGLGFAAIGAGDLGAAAAHFIAAGILGAQAGGAGAGGGGTKGKEAPRSLSAFRDGGQVAPTQYVWNINAPFFGNPQESARAFGEMQRSADGTGFEEAA